MCMIVSAGMRKRRASKSELETVTIWLTRESITKIRRMAQAEDRSVGKVLRRLLALALKSGAEPEQGQTP